MGIIAALFAQLGRLHWVCTSRGVLPMTTRRAPTAVIDLTEKAPVAGEAAEPDVAPVVVIYVPGLFEVPMSADAFAYRLATAIDEESPDVAPVYRVQPPSTGKTPSAGA